MTPAELEEPGGSQTTITERAADYLERQRFGEWVNADQIEFNAWLAESTLHEVAYLRLRGGVAQIDKLVVSRPFRFRRNAHIGSAGKYAKFALPLLAAASVASFALLGWQFLIPLMQPADRVDSTDIGGRTLLNFADHTQIELDTDTTVRVRMTTAQRTVWLEKGEAWFHVAHDAAHPFTVVVGKHRITDIGTEFLVRRDADDVDVALLSGRAALNADGTQTATLNPGEEALATPVLLSVVRRTPQQLADELAWRRGMLVFRDTPLAEVVREFNRYNMTKLVIADPAIAGKKITVNAKTDDCESFLRFLGDALKLRVDHEGNRILILSREETKEAVHLRRGL